MSNAFLLFAQGLDEAALQRVVPPSIRPKQIEPLAWNGDEFSFDLPPAALAGALEILPCLSVVHGGAWGYQFALECKTKAGHSSRAVLDPIGSFVGAEAGAADEAVAAEIDLLRIHTPCKRPPYTCASKASPPRPRPCSRSRCAAKAQCPLRPSPAEIRPSPCRRKARWFCGPSWLPTSARRPASPCSSPITVIVRTSTT